MAIKYAILGLLHYKGMHGYQIKKHIDRNFGHMWTVNYGQIYPNLKKLQAEGLIVMELTEPGDQGPNRKRYSITPKGREEFSRWLAGSPENRMLLRDPFLMRFVFYGFGEKDEALETIDGQIKLYEEQLDQRRSNYERWKTHGVYVRLIAELGLNLNEMFLDWLNRAREEIAAEEADGKNTASVL